MVATRVLGNRTHAEHWLHQPARGLDYRLPCSLVSNTSGYKRVHTLLNQIEYGIYV